MLEFFFFKKISLTNSLLNWFLPSLMKHISDDSTSQRFFQIFSRTEREKTHLKIYRKSVEGVARSSEEI